MKKSKARIGRPPGSQQARIDSESLIRPLVRRLRPYTPGEQPQVPGLTKLNTNENAYPPSPKVLAAIRGAVDERLRLYPDPTARRLREELARFHSCSPEHIIVGNGSDELLAMAVRAFVEPLKETARTRLANSGPLASLRAPPTRCTVQYFLPSYSLYPVLADIHGANKNPVPLDADFTLPRTSEMKRGIIWDRHAALTYITTPNAPTGRGYPTADLEALCRLQRGVVILDEAYADFAGENAMELALRYPHVIVSRTFSKAYSLCFQRIGYFVGPVPLIDALQKIRDSYNVNGLGQVGALATLENLAYYRQNIQRVIQTRQRLGDGLRALDWEVIPSEANFLFVHPTRFTAKAWREKLRQRQVLVRWWDEPEVRDYLRITIGTDAEADTLLQAVGDILS